MQNWPHAIQCFLQADEGYVAYSLDLSQAENREVAYLGNVTKMIDAFENGQDVHSLTASLIFDTPMEQIKREDDEHIPCSIGDGKHTKRYFGKKANHCSVETAQILTPTGWVTLKDWNETHELIAQWEPITQKITFVKALSCSRFKSKTLSLQGRNLQLTATPEHRVPVIRDGEYLVRKLKDLKTKSASSGIPLNGLLSVEKNLLTKDQLCLLVAYQADGTHSNKTQFEFKFKKGRKIARLLKLLMSLNIRFVSSNQANGMFRVAFQTSDAPWLSKNFNADLLKQDAEHLETFLLESTEWDGYERSTRKQYFSTNKTNVEWMQTIAHLCGYTAIMKELPKTGWQKKTLFSLTFSKIKKAALVSLTLSEGKEENVVGPEVPSGFILIRENGVISITGNSLNYDIGKRTFALDQEIKETQAAFIISRYHAAYPDIRDVFHTSIRQQINFNKTLTNLMGRKTVFLGKVCDQLYKEAYSCIPQGTVGDIINERGLNYVYYDNENFRNVELLAQTHDEIVFQIPLSIGWSEHVRILKLIKGKLETPLRLPNGREFVIPADITMMKRFKIGEKVRTLSVLGLSETFKALGG